MNTKAMVAIALTSAGTLVGCVSVESTRTQLNSGIPSQVKQAEENISSIARLGHVPQGMQEFQTGERVAFIGLTKNPKVLVEILQYSEIAEVKEAALKQYPYENPAAAKMFVEVLGEKEDLAKMPEMRKAIDGLDEESLTSLFNRHVGCSAVRQMCSMRLAEIGTSPHVLATIMRVNDSCAKDEAKKLALRRLIELGDVENTLRAIGEMRNPGEIFAMLNEQQVVALLTSEALENVGNEGGQRQIVEPLINKMNDTSCLLKVAAEAKQGWIGELALKKLDPAKLEEAVEAATPSLRASILSCTRDQKVILAVLKKDPVIRDESLAKKIASVEVAEYLLEHADFSGLKSRVEYTYGVRMEYPDSWQAAVIIEAIVKHIGQEKLKGIALQAINRAKEKSNNEIMIGGFYMGMPALDFFALSRVRKIGPEWGSSTVAKEKDWRMKYVVDCFEFKAKDRAVVLDCEDSLVLQQIIHQCVKHEKGKAKSFDYVTEIRHDIKIDKSWDGRKYEGSLWEEYVNTKMDVKIRYNKQDGVLVITRRQ